MTCIFETVNKLGSRPELPPDKEVCCKDGYGFTVLEVYNDGRAKVQVTSSNEIIKKIINSSAFTLLETLPEINDEVIKEIIPAKLDDVIEVAADIKLDAVIDIPADLEVKE